MRLWLDDERNPADDDVQKKYGSKPDDVWVKTFGEAIVLINSGAVTAISIDNHLGDGKKTGLDFANWLAEECEAGRVDTSCFNSRSLKCHSDMMNDKENENSLFWKIKEPFRRIVQCNTRKEFD